jgi:cell division protein FtsQ
VPLVLDRDETILEISGDRLVILGPHEVDHHHDVVRTAGTRRTVAVATASSVETPEDADPVNRDGVAPRTTSSFEHQRFTDRRALVAEEQVTNRRRRRGRAVAGAVLVSGAGLALSASPLLRVDEVRIVGLHSLNPQVVHDAVDASDHPSMLTVKVAEIETRLNALPLVHGARVWKQWPDQLVVEISERFPVATAKSEGGWSILDQRGEVLETRQARPELPQFDLTGPIDPNDPGVRDLLQVAIGSSPRLRQQIDSLSLRGDGVEIRLRPAVVDNDELLIRFGHVDDVQAKLRALETMLDPATKAPLQGLSVLDLTVADQPALMPPTTIAVEVIPASDANATASTDAVSSTPTTVQ